ncbi:MAG TPA: nicotinate-nucleotide--dimethylbenzimidazole phosphoribosyltransferase [Sedimenticola thiotaurini]|uniref:Nicotinate-nucleotide--dimethylbenzimidazole phosphoribosyltransferase n=1 Tax=Sedimenticola thiotaurini TaxID=1543721 RepID=A0A831WAX4_9GAMM|nr:nicotinate-nucleotide--dimethylbenzimidazole phosphoribosyltransferase [Sedimenticola thiotaurini]
MTAKWLTEPALRPDREAEQAALRRQGQLTKPAGSLGRLEQIAVRLAALQGQERPAVDPAWIAVFAADHGVAVEGVSAFPQAVTGQMVANFVAGGAAISVLAERLGARLEVFDLGVVGEPAPATGVISRRAGAGSANLRRCDAMTGAQLEQSLGAGAEAVDRALEGGGRLFIGGEMGIANTTAASALACALLELEPGLLAGPGTGLDRDGVARKAEVIRDALARTGPLQRQPLEALRRLGGFEIAALCGSCLRAAQRGLPVLVDGFIASVAALAAVRHLPGVADWLIFSHRSAEPGHQAVLEALAAEPLLDLGMRLGEGSGAAVALPLLQLACRLHDGMATFADAGISES